MCDSGRHSNSGDEGSECPNKGHSVRAYSRNPYTVLDDAGGNCGGLAANVALERPAPIAMTSFASASNVPFREKSANRESTEPALRSGAPCASVPNHATNTLGVHIADVASQTRFT